nr:putative tRNA/rRNA methyltransferase [uncultured bacterium]
MSVKKGGQGGRGNKPGSHRKGAATGSGGQAKRRLEGKGPTPPAEARKGHPAARRAASAAKRASTSAKPTRVNAPAKARGTKPNPDAPEIVVGRNPVVEALRAKVPATALYVAHGTDNDERMTEAVAIAGKAGLALMEMSRAQLDKMTGGVVHQGLALQVPPYTYHHPDDLLARALETATPLLVALDGVTDPRNLGAVVRSAAAFGAQGVLLPERRSAGMTAAAWRTSAGAAARLPVARCTNLVRTLSAYKEAGLFVVGLAADGDVSLDDLEMATSPLVVVVGSEGEGLGRLVAQTCDLTVSIPMSGLTESLNAGIAAAVTLAEVARRRRIG